VDARRAIERIDLQTRIIRQNKMFRALPTAFPVLPAGQLLRLTVRFFHRVAVEGVRVLDRFRRARKIVQGQILKTLAEDGANFLHLVSVCRGDEQNDHVAL